MTVKKSLYIYSHEKFVIIINHILYICINFNKHDREVSHPVGVK